MADLKTLTIDGVANLANPAHQQSSIRNNISLTANTAETTDFITIADPGLYAVFVRSRFGAASTTGMLRRATGIVQQSDPTNIAWVEDDYEDGAQAGYKTITAIIRVASSLTVAGAIRATKATASANCNINILAVKIANLD